MEHRAELLIIEDDAASARLLTAIAESGGHESTTCATGRAGLARAKAHEPGLVLLDVQLPDVGGLEVLAELRSGMPDVPVILVTGSADVATAVAAMRQGAFDYVTKPVSVDALGVAIDRALETRALRERVRTLERRAAMGLRDRMGSSACIGKIVEEVGRVAPTELSVLVEGETGSGKELVARAIHEQSARAEGPLIAIDCGAIPEGLFDSELFGHEKGAFTGAERARPGTFRLAQGGTLFLDEIANLGPSAQAKLLRVLEVRRARRLGADKDEVIDVRVIAAGNRGLLEEVRKGRFREDLYYRLAEFSIRVPPLRERAEDVEPLARRFLAEASLELKRAVTDLSPGALKVLATHTWPGNVRELRNVVRRAVLSTEGSCVAREAVDSLCRSTGGRLADVSLERGDAEVDGEPRSLKDVAGAAVETAERRAILRALDAARGNKAEAARRLQTDYKTLYSKIRRYGLQR